MATKARSTRIKVSGEAVAFVEEETTSTDDILYRIDDTTMRVWDPTATVTVYDGGVEVDPDVDPYEVVRLRGDIVFSTEDAGRDITVSGSYLPLSTVADVRNYSLTVTATNADESTIEDSQVTRMQTLTDCAASLSGWRGSDYFRDAIDDDTVFVLELSVASGSTPIARAWVKPSSASSSIAIAGLQEETIEMEGVADADGRSVAFLE